MKKLKNHILSLDIKDENRYSLPKTTTNRVSNAKIQKSMTHFLDNVSNASLNEYSASVATVGNRFSESHMPRKNTNRTLHQ